MAAAPLYITQQRLSVVDFSRPFLTTEASILLRRPPTGQTAPITRAFDLLKQSEIKFGTLQSGVIRRAFRSANISENSALWRKIKRFRPSTLTSTNDQGIERVRQDKYAFILPSVIADYVTLRPPCDLISIDRFLMKHYYGLATPKGSGLLTHLNTAIYLIENSGYLNALYKKWWTDRTQCNGIKSSKMYSLSNSNNRYFSRNYFSCVFILFVVNMYAILW